MRLFASLMICASAASATERPNVLFISVDDLKPALACAGDPHAKTPNIDRLAARGVTFTRAYCQQAVCSPSRSSLMTGCRPDTTKVYDLVTHFRKAMPEAVTLSQHFKNHGYYAHGVGKIFHAGYNDVPSWTVPWETSKGASFGTGGQKLMAELKAKAAEADKVRGLPTEVADLPDEKLNDGWTAARAIEIIKSRKGAKEPFFLAVGFLKPHLPFVAPKQYWDLYDPAKLPTPAVSTAPEGAPPYGPQNGGELRQYHGVPKSGPIPPEQARTLVHGYYAAVSFMDAQVGKLLDAIESEGLRDNTAIILWGDHGWHLGDHGIWCKHTNYEQATRAALVMAAPKAKSQGARSAALVEFVDIYPTLAEVCGLPAPAKVEGHSFAPLLVEPNKAWKQAAFSQYPRANKDTGPVMGYAVRTEQHRYVQWQKRSDASVLAEELYDLQADPNETKNLAADAGAKDIVARHAKLLRAGWAANAPPK
jgi:iduronate 2-sulfatase